MSRGLCRSCRKLVEIARIDELERSFCADCIDGQAPSREKLIATYLANTIPFAVGDRVSYKTAGVHYDGIGRVEEISTDPADLASPVVPMFRLAMVEKAYDTVPDEVWASEVCMERV